MSGQDPDLVIRRAEHADVPNVVALCDEVGAASLQEQYGIDGGALNVGATIERSSLSVVALGDGGKVVGFASFAILCPAGRSEMWLECLDRNEFTASNILWMQFFVVDPLYAMEASELIFRTAFATIARVDHILLAQKGMGLPEAPLDDIMSKVDIHGINRMSDSYTLYNCDRHLYAARLVIRPARVEDHDDLAPIFQSKTQDLTDTYGEFFLADLIASQDDQNKCLVAEVDGKAAGLMSLSSAVQVDILQECFQLKPYGQLLKQVDVEEDVLKDDWTVLFEGIKDAVRHGVGLTGASPLEAQSKKFSFTQLLAAVNGVEAEEHCSAADRAKIVKKLRRCFFHLREATASDTDEARASLTWTSVLAEIALYQDRLQLWKSWYGLGPGGRDAVLQAHERANGSRDDMLRVLGQKDEALGPLLGRALQLDSLQSSVDIVSYNDVIVSSQTLEDALSEFEAAIVAYSGYRMAVYNAEKSPGLRDMVKRLAATSHLPILSSADIAAKELEKIRRTWSDKESKPPTSLDSSVISQLVCAAAAEEEHAGQGFVLLDFPKTPNEFEQLKKAGVTLSGLVYCGEGRGARAGESEEAQVVHANKPERAHFAAIDVTQKPRAVAAALQEAFVESVLARHSSKVTKTRVTPKTTCSAFAITLFTLDDQYESSSSEFMEAAFELFPDHDYCMITLPYTAPESALLQQFTRVPAEPNSTFSHMLFIQHRSTPVNLEDLFVSDATAGDRQALATLLAPLGGGSSAGLDQAISADFEVAVAKLPVHGGAEGQVQLQTFLARCDGHVVAVVVVDPNVDEARQRDLADSFRLEEIAPVEFHSGRFATLRRYYVDPIFERHTRFILEECLRLADRSTLLYSPPVSQQDGLIDTAVSVAVTEFVQLQPYQLDQQAVRDASSKFFDQPGPATLRRQAAATAAASDSALYALPMRLISEPRLINNQRIVVVGASDCGVAFLESLLFVPYLQFTNLVLVSTHGLPSGRPEQLRSVRSLVSPPSNYTRRHLRQINLGASVRVIEKTVVAIDRESKCVVVPADSNPDEDDFIMYDHLVIATGQQGTARATLTTPDPVTGRGGEIPQHVYFLGESGNTSDVVGATERLNELASDDKANVVVYGGTLMALQAIEAALTAGIPGTRISWYFEDIPDLLQQVDRLVWDTVSLRLKRLGVLTSPQHELVSVTADPGTGGVASATFASTKRAVPKSFDGDMLLQAAVDHLGVPASSSSVEDSSLHSTEKCAILLCASRPRVDPEMFEAVTESGLVFDGHIVVDHNFRTVDDCIYSGGTVAKFSRKYHPQFNIEAYSSREAGARIATAVQQRIDPLAMPDEDDDDAFEAATGLVTNASLPAFATPKLQYYRLPGGLHFMDSCIADQPAPVRTFATAAEDVSAQDSDVQFRYSWVTLDRRMRMVQFTYVGTRDVPARNLSRLVGFNEAFLNSLRHAHDSGRIDDHVDYFAQPWAKALYCQHFEEFYSDLHMLVRSSGELQEILASLEAADQAEEEAKNGGGGGGSQSGRSAQDKTEAMVLALHDRVAVGGTKLSAGFRRQIQRRVIDFLRKNHHLVAGYFVPSEEVVQAAVAAETKESSDSTN